MRADELTGVTLHHDVIARLERFNASVANMATRLDDATEKRAQFNVSDEYLFVRVCVLVRVKVLAICLLGVIYYIRTEVGSDSKRFSYLRNVISAYMRGLRILSNRAYIKIDEPLFLAMNRS